MKKLIAAIALVMCTYIPVASAIETVGTGPGGTLVAAQVMTPYELSIKAEAEDNLYNVLKEITSNHYIGINFGNGYIEFDGVFILLRESWSVPVCEEDTGISSTWGAN